MIDVHKMIQVRNAEFIQLYAKSARPERGQEPPDASKKDLRLLKMMHFILQNGDFKGLYDLLG